MNRTETVAVALLALCGFGVLVALMAFVGGMEWRHHRERQAFRAALAGDCPLALKRAGQAGFMPYEVSQRCGEEAR